MRHGGRSGWPARRSVGSMLPPPMLSRLPIACRWPWLFALALTTGCTQTRTDVRDALARRIAPEEVSAARRDPPEKGVEAVGPTTADAMVRRTGVSPPEGR